MLTIVSHNIQVGDVLTHGPCGNIFHYLALRWSLGQPEPIAVMVCPKCHGANDSKAAMAVAERIWEKFQAEMWPPRGKKKTVA